jgi:hypothetical protein
LFGLPEISLSDSSSMTIRACLALRFLASSS